ncbi:MAG TPA: MFS transporter [Xanthobacteraceae bacterium]|jgi:predicted MFS family arabinose efflux permease|nr:MFS transporter [Xanthobacteraceae bacterium]
MRSSLLALGALNFFMADVIGGLGPFLGVFLQARQWTPAEIGLVMTAGGISGMAVTTPLGALADRTHAKRTIVVIAAAVVTVGSIAIFLRPEFPIVVVSQVVIGMAGAAAAPAIAAITLGLVHQDGFPHQLGRNEACNHAGNVVAAGLAGAAGYAFGLGAAFIVLAIMAAFAIAAALQIDPHKIDYRAARGAAEHDGDGSSGFVVLLRSAPLIVLGVTLTLFHLGNAAMLPLLGQAAMAHGAGDPSAFTGVTIIIAQITMVPIALIAARLAETRGYWIVFLLALIALPIRGLAAALLVGPWAVVPVQVLDGFGAGILGVAVPGLVARILLGTGHVNAGLGAVMTLQGIGAALSPALGGIIAQRFGYPVTFLSLGAIALIALVLWVVVRPVTALACAARSRNDQYDFGRPRTRSAM